jgi:hypothetical protein
MTHHLAITLFLPLIRRIPRLWSLFKFDFTLYVQLYSPLVPPYSNSSSQATFFLAALGMVCFYSMSLAICFAKCPLLLFLALKILLIIQDLA